MAYTIPPETLARLKAPHADRLEHCQQAAATRRACTAAATAAVLALPKGHTDDDIARALADAVKPYPAEYHQRAVNDARATHQRRFHPARSAPDYPGPGPRNLPPMTPAVTPEFPPLGLDHPKVHEEWESAHLTAHRALYNLQPAIIDAWAEHALQVARYEAFQSGRKGGKGDFRKSVPRNLLETTRAEQKDRHGATLARAQAMIERIASGDAEVVEGPAYSGTHHTQRMGPEDARIDWSRTELHDDGLRVRSRRQREEQEARLAARAARTPEEKEAEYEAMVASALAQPLPREPKVDLTNLFELPDNPDDLRGRALCEMVAYIGVAVKKGEKEAAEARTKERTAQRRAAEAADPEAAKAAREATARTKAREREARRNARMTPEQRRERERLKKQRQRAAKAAKG